MIEIRTSISLIQIKLKSLNSASQKHIFFHIKYKEDTQLNDFLRIAHDKYKNSWED